MSEIQRKQANIRLLQRVSNTTAISGSVDVVGASSSSSSNSREITDIVATATHVVLYEFLITSSTQSWTKCNIEGSLFLIQGNQKQQHNNNTNTNIVKIQPYYQLIILNRTSTNNFICNVDTTIQIHDESPFIIVKQHENQSNGRILGFWFHNADERLSLYNQLQTTIQNITTAYQTTSIQLTQPQPSIPQQQQQQSSTTSTFVTSTAITNDVTADSTATSLAALSLKTVLGIGSTSNNDSSSLTSSTTTIATAKVSPTTVTTSSLTTQSTPISSTNAVVGAATVDSNNQTPTTAATNNTTTNNNNTFVLDKKSLQLTLLSLIQDDRFIDLVHSQYLKVVRTRAAKTSSLQQVQPQQQSQSTPSPPQPHP